jgi:hypothetical protein
LGREEGAVGGLGWVEMTCKVLSGHSIEWHWEKGVGGWDGKTLGCIGYHWVAWVALDSTG